MRLTTMLGVLAAVAPAAGAQNAAARGTLAARVDASKAPAVAFEFPARPGVCGDGRGSIRVGEHTFVGTWNSRTWQDAPCVPGPVRVVLRRSNGALADVHASVGPTPDDGAADLGPVSAAEGSSYLLDLVERTGGAADDAIQAAILGEGVNAGPRLLAIAREQRASHGTKRHDPLFWAGQYAAAKLAGRDTPFGGAGCERDDDKSAAVFALSQLRDGQAVPALLDVVRANRDACVRAGALFWLVESGDDRALDAVGSILGSG